MDKIKAQLAIAMKYGFWIGTVLILISSLAVWYMSTSTLASETDSESGRLEGVLRKISTVKGAMSALPNAKSHQAMEEIVKQRQDEVLKSWQTLFDRQKDHLTWPRDVLLDDFVDKFEGKIPIEQYIDFPDPAPLSPFYLNRYRDHIIKEPAKLAAIAGAVWTASENQATSGIGNLGGSTDQVDEVPVVAWSTSSQKSLYDEIFRWYGETPTTLECYYSQESQWILKQLMMIIKEVNGAATHPYQAKIREIEEIHIGPSVNFSVGEFTGIQGGGSMTSMASSTPGGPSSSISGGLTPMGGLGGAAGSSRPTGSTVDPAEHRYVDANLNHIDASSLRTALKSNKPSDAGLAIAKRVPVMMGLNMDQRHVSDLLAACGSADLMVEVSHVRVLSGSGSTKSSGGSRSSGSGGMGGLGALGGGGSRSAATSTSSAVDEYPFDVNVELYGIIYIYNTPDPGKLPVEQVTNATVEEDLGEALGETPVNSAATDATQPIPQVNDELRPPTDGTEPPSGDGGATPPTPDANAPDANAPDGIAPDETVAPDAVVPPAENPDAAPATPEPATPEPATPAPATP